MSLTLMVIQLSSKKKKKRKNHLQITTTTFSNISLNDVAISMLEHYSLTYSSRTESGLTISSEKKAKRKIKI